MSILSLFNYDLLYFNKLNTQLHITLLEMQSNQIHSKGNIDFSSLAHVY